MVKKKPLKNYIIYFTLIIITILFTILLSNKYKNLKNLEKENSVMKQFLTSLNEKEFENYIAENNNAIIYMASGTDETIKDFEEKFKEMLIDYDLQSQIIYIDLDNVDQSFLLNLQNNYFKESLGNISLYKYPNILILENGKISAVLYSSEKIINLIDVEEFFYNRGVIAQAW